MITTGNGNNKKVRIGAIFAGMIKLRGRTINPGERIKRQISVVEKNRR